MSEDLIEDAVVGEHHVNGVQCDVPLPVLRQLRADPGDRLRFVVVGPGVIRVLYLEDSP